MNEHHALKPAGAQASHIAELFWWYFGVCLFVWVAVVLALVMALLHRRRDTGASAPETELDPHRERRIRVTVGLLVGATTLTLFALLAGSIFTGRALAGMAPKEVLTIEVKGQMWWWSFVVQGDDPSQDVFTPNELHIPVGRPVKLEMTSTDVIHSFWVPALHGKRDLIPGRKTTLCIQADKPGRYEGRCAEFCGVQHAHMAFVVVADPPEVFDAWLAKMRQTPPKPAPGSQEARGAEVFMAARCASCHSIQGTDAFGSVGPDLTHVASRASLASGAVANEPQAMAAWIRDPQRAKPGSQMPASPLAPEDLDALVTYLRSLQ